MIPTAKTGNPIYLSRLAELLAERIRREGPLTFRDWMDAALYHPTEGYYCNASGERWGRQGDYRTSPERSELFAATFAHYFAGLYDKLEKPSDWTIVEVGAGDGRFAQIVLQNLQRYSPEVFRATLYVIDELSADSRERAGERVASFGDRVQFETLAHLDRINPGIVFSNELFDAFPIHRLTNQGGKLVELYVTVSPQGRFEWTTGTVSSQRLEEYCALAGLDPGPGQIIEVNLAMEDWLECIADKLTNGYVITVDYGAAAGELHDDPARYHGTLRGYYRHQIIDDVLTRPGELDITTTVNWTDVKRVGNGLGFAVREHASQDRFLIKAGLLDHLQRELEMTKSDADKLRLTTSAREMILPGGMSSNFQVLVQERT